ncbi:Ethr (predicted) [Pycnogonum litorale]
MQRDQPETDNSTLVAQTIRLINQSINDRSSSSDVSDEPLAFPLSIRIVVSVLCILTLIIGTSGNIMVPVVVWSNRDMRNSTNIFLVNLSIADLLILVICVPTVLVEIHSQPETWILGKIMCKIVPYLESTVAHGSILTILAISFERYYAICQPLRAGYKCTNSRATIIILVVWSVAVVITSPVILTTDYFHATYVDGSSVPVCVTLAQTLWQKIYFLSMQFALFVLPLVILVVVYAVITFHLAKNLSLPTSPRTSKKNRPRHHSSTKSRKQVIATLTAVVVAFFVCLLPMKSFQSWVIIESIDNIRLVGPDTYYVLLFLCRLMFYLNSTINPILYNVISTKFRQAFLRQIKCRKRAFVSRDGATSSMTSSSYAGQTIRDVNSTKECFALRNTKQCNSVSQSAL